jgi:catechol 2,3-dioxygenase-like lactoylglutathione lyase family enzyme
MLGFRVVSTFHEKGNAALDRGLGMPYTHNDALFLRIGHERRETVIDLVQWHDPKPVGGAPVLNQLGAPRICFRVDDLDATMTKLAANGVKFLSDPQTLHFERDARFVLFKDPDGLFLELVELSPAQPKKTAI